MLQPLPKQVQVREVKRTEVLVENRRKFGAWQYGLVCGLFGRTVGAICGDLRGLGMQQFKDTNERRNEETRMVGRVNVLDIVLFF